MEEQLKKVIAKAFFHCFNLVVDNEITIQRTRREFKGDYTINVFPWVKKIRK